MDGAMTVWQIFLDDLKYTHANDLIRTKIP